MFPNIFVVLMVLGPVFATVFVTNPTSSTTMTGGKDATITWQDDGMAPNLISFGPSKISIYVGNALQQTSLQTINASVDVSTISSVTFVPDPTIGPNGNDYFIRFESISLRDTTTPTLPALAFSARYTMNGMTGTFSAAIQAEINGQSTAPLLAGATTTSVVQSLSGSSSAVSSTATPSMKTSQSLSSTLAPSVSSNVPSTTLSSTAKSTTTTSNSNSALSLKASLTGVVMGAVALGAVIF